MIEYQARHPEALWPVPDTVIWSSAKGSRFNQTFREVLKKLGLKEDSFGNLYSSYSLRHTGITKSIKNGVNLSVLAENCGTSVPMLTKFYSHIIHLNHAAEILKGT